VGSLTVTKSFLTMLLFAALMLLAAFLMIRGSKDYSDNHKPGNIIKLLLYGIAIGLVTGLMGAGGGFLLIPALVMLVKLPIKKAIGTSLAIIAQTALFGFLVDLWHQRIDWPMLLSITIIAMLGITAGIRLSQSIEGVKLKQGFGWFVMIMGFFILILQTVTFLFL
jgi:uncharacterized protein